MSLFDIRPGIVESHEDDFRIEIMPEEAKLHGLFSALSTDYARLIKERILVKINCPKNYKIRDFQVLSAIYSSSKTMTASDVYRGTGLDPATVTRSVKLLKDNGHLDVEENEADTRSRFLVKTQKGEDLANSYGEACADVFVPNSETSPFLINDKELKAVTSMLIMLRQRVNVLRQICT